MGDHWACRIPMKFTKHCLGLIWLLTPISLLLAQKAPAVPKDLALQIVKDDPEVKESLKIQPDGSTTALTVKTMHLAVDGKATFYVRATPDSGRCGDHDRCLVFIYSKTANQYQLLLEEHAGALTGLKTITKGYHDLLLRDDVTGFETLYRTFKFDGKRYKAVKCFTSGELDLRPVDTPQDCESVNEIYPVKDNPVER